MMTSLSTDWLWNSLVNTQQTYSILFLCHMNSAQHLGCKTATLPILGMNMFHKRITKELLVRLAPCPGKSGWIQTNCMGEFCVIAVRCKAAMHWMEHSQATGCHVAWVVVVLDCFFPLILQWHLSFQGLHPNQSTAPESSGASLMQCCWVQTRPQQSCP